jgi:hypothetical protein
MDSAMVAIMHGAHDAQERVSGALPAIGQFMSRMVYTSCYGLSYGVVFPVMMVVRLVPKENAMVHGFVDGAIAAREQVEGWGAEMIEDHHDGDEFEAEDDVTKSNDSSRAKSNHRHRSTSRRSSAKATKSPRKR